MCLKKYVYGGENIMQEHKRFRFTRNITVQQVFEIEAMHDAHARAKIRRELNKGELTPVSQQTIRTGHLTPEKKE